MKPQNNVANSEYKDPSIIIEDINKDGKRLITLKTDSYIGNAYHMMQSGIINKTETGIGATRCELGAPRNSIIVEPVKIIASSKALAMGPKALYIGSPTQKARGKVTHQQIVDYINDPTIVPKKILVVADSIHRIMDVIKNDINDYFLMIDEVDSFQNDAVFRDSMEICMDYYHMFLPENRALVTATMLEFSDPKLLLESRTEYSYEIPKVRNIHIVNTINIEGCAIQVILDLVKNNPSQKILIAYNYVIGCLNIATHLAKHNKIPKSDIKIMCGTSNKKKAANYYAELNDVVLPGKINFITAAYFSGFDLYEMYHQVSITTNTNSIYTLSNHKIKQIAGRCRLTLLSETVINHTEICPGGAPSLKKNDLFAAAKHEIVALGCIEHNYKNNLYLKRSFEKIRSSVIENTTINSFPIVRRNIDEENVISYLSIDAALESNRVMDKIYGSADGLKNSLQSDGHNISVSNDSSSLKVKKQTIGAKILNDEVKDIINRIKQTSGGADVQDLLFMPDLNQRQKEMVEIYKENMSHVDRSQLLRLIEETAKGRDNRALMNLGTTLRFSILADNHFWKRAVNSHLEIGKTYTQEGLKAKWDTIKTEIPLYDRVDNVNKAVHLTNLYFNILRDTKKGTFTIQSFKTPVVVINPREAEPDPNDIWSQAIYSQ